MDWVAGVIAGRAIDRRSDVRPEPCQSVGRTLVAAQQDTVRDVIHAFADCLGLTNPKGGGRAYDSHVV